MPSSNNCSTFHQHNFIFELINVGYTYDFIIPTLNINVALFDWCRMICVYFLVIFMFILRVVSAILSTSLSASSLLSVTRLFRWSKIARHLPGRTDNEIKNYWRTRIQKQIKQAETYTNQNFNATQNAGTSYSGGPSEGVQTFSPMHMNNNPDSFATPMSTESNENFWSMEDLWSSQLFSGD